MSEQRVSPFLIAPQLILEDERLTLVEIRVLLAICSFRDSLTNICYPSREKLGERARVGSPQRVSRTITSLAEKGWLEVTNRQRECRSSEYKLTIPSCLQCDRISHHPSDRISHHPSDRISHHPGDRIGHHINKEGTDQVEQTTSLSPQTPHGGLALNGKAKFDPKSIVLPDAIPQYAWDGFVDHRREMKSPVTESTAKTLIKGLMKLASEGQDVGACLEQSIMHGWRGVFPVKNNNHTSSNGPRNHKYAHLIDPSFPAVPRF